MVFKATLIIKIRNGIIFHLSINFKIMLMADSMCMISFSKNVIKAKILIKLVIAISNPVKFSHLIV